MNTEQNQELERFIKIANSIKEQHPKMNVLVVRHVTPEFSRLETRGDMTGTVVVGDILKRQGVNSVVTVVAVV